MKLKYIPLLVLCSCSADPDSGLLPDTPAFADQISLHSGIGTVSAVQTRGDGIISGTLTADLPVAFVRVDKPYNGSYPGNYTSIDELDAFITKTNKVIAFNPAQHYLTDGGSTKFIGWYPATATWNAPAGTVTFPVLDGTTDILVSSTVEGHKRDMFTASQHRISFGHVLTQVQVFVFLEDAAYGVLWGDLTGITLVDKAQVCTLTLPTADAAAGASATASFAASTIALPLQKPDNSGVVTTYTMSAEVPDTAIGYAMFAPHTQDTDNLVLKVTTVKGGAHDITIPYASMKLEAGKSYDIFLKFLAYRIEPTATITEWVTAPAGEQPGTVPVS